MLEVDPSRVDRLINDTMQTLPHNALSLIASHHSQIWEAEECDRRRTDALVRDAARKLPDDVLSMIASQHRLIWDKKRRTLHRSVVLELQRAIDTVKCVYEGENWLRLGMIADEGERDIRDIIDDYVTESHGELIQYIQHPPLSST